MKSRIALAALAILLLAGTRFLAPGSSSEIEAHTLESPSVLGELEDIIWSADGDTVGLVGLVGQTRKTALFNVSGSHAPEFIETIEGYQPRLSPQGTQMLTTTFKMNEPSYFVRHFPGSSKESEYLSYPAFPGPLFWLDETTVIAIISASDHEELAVIGIDGPLIMPISNRVPANYREPSGSTRTTIARDSKRSSAPPTPLGRVSLAPGHISIERENGATSIISENRSASFTLPDQYEPNAVVNERFLLATSQSGHQLQLSVFDLSGKQPRHDLGSFSDVIAVTSGHVIIEDDERHLYLTQFENNRLDGRRELKFIDRSGNQLIPARFSFSPDGSRVVFATARGTRLFVARILAN